MSNRDLFISEVAKNLNVTTPKAKEISETVIDTIIDCVAKNGEVSFPQKLKFEISERKARTCKNPRTGEDIEVPASRTIHLTVRPLVKEKLNG